MCAELQAHCCFPRRVQRSGWQRVRNPSLKGCSAHAFLCLPQSLGSNSSTSPEFWDRGKAPQDPLECQVRRDGDRSQWWEWGTFDSSDHLLEFPFAFVWMIPRLCLTLLLDFGTGWKHKEAERKFLWYQELTFLPHVTSCFPCFMRLFLNQLHWSSSSSLIFPKRHPFSTETSQRFFQKLPRNFPAPMAVLVMPDCPSGFLVCLVLSVLCTLIPGTSQILQQTRTSQMLFSKTWLFSRHNTEVSHQSLLQPSRCCDFLLWAWDIPHRQLPCA